MKFFDFDRVLATIYERKNESFLTFRQIFFFLNEQKKKFLNVVTDKLQYIRKKMRQDVFI